MKTTNLLREAVLSLQENPSPMGMQLFKVEVAKHLQYDPTSLTAAKHLHAILNKPPVSTAILQIMASLMLDTAIKPDCSNPIIASIEPQLGRYVDILTKRAEQLSNAMRQL